MKEKIRREARIFGLADFGARYLAERIYALRYQIAREVLVEYIGFVPDGTGKLSTFRYWLDQKEEQCQA